MNDFEKAILYYFVDEMERTGTTYKAIHCSFTPNELKLINEKYSIQMKIEEMEKTLNKLLANEYIKHITLGGQFQNLGITPKGVGIVNSLRKKELQLQNRTITKKISDAVLEYEGIGKIITIVFAMFGFIFVLLKIKAFFETN